MTDTGQVSGEAAIKLAFTAYESGKAEARAEQRHALWQTDTGPVSITFPAHMDLHDVGFLEEFVAIWLRGLRRRAERLASHPPEGVAHPSAQVGEGASGAEGDAQPTASKPDLTPIPTPECDG